MKTQIWMVSEHKVDQICIAFIYMHLPNLKWLDPIEIPLGQPFDAVCPAQSAERPDIGQAEVERYRQQLEKAREQPEAILVLEVTWVCHWRNRGKPPDFIRCHGWLYHFPSFSQWLAFVFGRDTQFSHKTHLGMDRWLSPSQEPSDRIWGSIYIMP